MTLSWRFAAASDVGLLRDGNEDSGYAGPRLVAVADGMGGHAAGEVASAAAIAAIAGLDAPASDADPEERLRRGIHAANTTLRDMVAADPDLAGMGTTVTAAVTDGERMLLAHIGDSRAYLLRDGELTRLTRDHTLVQQLVDEGRLDEADVSSHPQRSMLTRTLDGRADLRPDVTTHDVRPGDRLLICSDGLSGVVSDQTIAEVLGQGTPEQAVLALVELALRGGAPDNVTAVVADPVETPPDDAPLVVGAAGGAMPTAVPRTAAAGAAAATTSPRTGEDSPATRAKAVTTAAPRTHERARRLRRRRTLVVALLALLGVGAAAGGGWAYVRSHYYVGVADDEVAIYRGVDGRLGPVRLNSLEERTGVALGSLPPFVQEDVRDGIAAGSREAAAAIVARLEEQVVPSLPPCPSPTPAPTRTPSRSPAPRPTATPTRSAVRPTPTPTTTPTAPRPVPSPSPTCLTVLR